MAELNAWGVAEQAIEPGPLVSGAIVAGLALAVGLPIVVAPVAGLAVLGGMAVAAARSKYGRPESEVASRAKQVRRKLSPRWQLFVDEAQRDQKRFDEAVERVADPAIRDALLESGPRFHEVVDSVVVIAARGQQLEDAVGQLPDAASLGARIDELIDSGATPNDKRLTSARYQLDMRDRIEAQVVDIVHRLEQIDADRDVAVVQAVEAGLNSDDTRVLRDLTSSLEHAVAELDALNRAMVEIDDIR